MHGQFRGTALTQQEQQKHLNQLFILAAHTQVLDQYPLPALVLQTSHSFPLQSTTIFPLGSRFITLPATSKDDYTRFMLGVSVSASDYLCLFFRLILAMCDAKHM